MASRSSGGGKKIVGELYMVTKKEFLLSKLTNEQRNYVYKKITKNQKNNLKQKMWSGNYYLWLSPWSNVYGQQISVWPTNAYLARNKKVKPDATHYQVLTPNDPKPKITNGGTFTKRGRFYILSPPLYKFFFK